MALRGTVPGAQREPRGPTPDNPAALVVVLVVLVAAVGVVMLAVMMRARQRTAAPAAAGPGPEWLRRDAGRLTWRAVLAAFVVVLAWLALSVWLSRWQGGHGLDPPTFVPDATPDTTPDTTAGSPAQSDPVAPAGESPLLGYLYAATVLFLVVLAVGTVSTARRTPRAVAAAAPDAAVQTTGGADGSETLARAAEVALAEVEDLNREPRSAIIACYIAMERELAGVPGAAPQDTDTASEVLARAVAQHALRAGTATQLVDLFDEARFSPHVMTENHRATAVDVLTQVLAEMRSRA